ncbi:unnamed protein product, partial [Owenia fusiformis]
PPRDVKGTEINEKSITISWKRPSNGHYTGYDLNYVVDPNVTSISVGRSATSITLSNLGPATNITFRVRTYVNFTDIPLVRYSRTITITQLTKPLPPLAGSVVANAINSTSIKLDWKEPERKPKGGYDGYRINISPPDENNENNTFLDQKLFSFTITNLYPGRLYSLSVRSVKATQESRGAFANGGAGQLTKPSPPGE